MIMVSQFIYIAMIMVKVNEITTLADFKLCLS